MTIPEDSVPVIATDQAISHDRVAAARMAPYLKSEDVIAIIEAKRDPLKPSRAPLFNSQDLYGQWVGTYRSAKTLDADYDGAIAIDFYRRQAVPRTSLTQAFTGTIDLSAMGGAADVITTVTMGRSLDVRIVVDTPTADVGFTGAVSLNGQVITGRYARFVGSQYEVGTFTLVKQPFAQDI